MKKTPSLEDFIKTYVSNKSIADKKDSYAEWLTKNGDASPRYSDKVLGLNTSHLRARVGYGAKGSSLAESGLLKSGYASYLSDSQKARNSIAMAEAADESRRLAEAENKKYSDYVEGYNTEIERLGKSVSDSLSKNATTDYNKAYE